MQIDFLTINASPLILLSKAGLEHFLPKLFSRIVVPESVCAEVAAGGDRATQVVENAEWIERLPVKVRDEVLHWNLGAGESEVLSFALANPKFRASIDDRAARRCAESLSISTLGTGGILLLAKRRGLITSIKTSLLELKDAGLYISDDLLAVLLKEAGE